MLNTKTFIQVLLDYNDLYHILLFNNPNAVGINIFKLLKLTLQTFFTDHNHDHILLQIKHRENRFNQ